jgi:hypothetical protein
VHPVRVVVLLALVVEIVEWLALLANFAIVYATHTHTHTQYNTIQVMKIQISSVRFVVCTIL